MMVQKGENKIIWFKNKFHTKSLSLLIFVIIFFILAFIYGIIVSQNVEVPIIISGFTWIIISFFIPIYLLSSFYKDAPKMIGISNHALYAKYIKKIKNEGKSELFGKNVIKYFEKIPWEEVQKISRNKFDEKINKKIAITVGIMVITRKNIYPIVYCSMDLLLLIINHQENYKKYKKNYNPKKI